MKGIKLIMASVATLLVCSCSSIQHTATTADVQTKVVNFTVADVKTNGQKVSKTTSWNFNPFKRVSVSTEIKNTEAKMLMETGNDILLEPQYIVEKRGFLRGGSVTVIGIPAKYVNFHKMTPEEATIISKMNVDDKKCNVKKKKWFLF